MANKKFWLGMLVIVLVFGMTVVGCKEEDKDDDDDNKFKEVGVIVIQSAPSNGQKFTATLTGTGLTWKSDVADAQVLSLYSSLMNGDGSLTFSGGSFNGSAVVGTYGYFEVTRESGMDNRLNFDVIDGTTYYNKIIGTVTSKNDNRTLGEFTAYINGLEAYRTSDWLRITGDATLK